MEKMTNVKALAYVLAHADLPSDVKEKVEKMKAQFEKKNSAEKKPTAQQVANKGIAEDIVKALANEPNRLFTITEIMKSVPSCADLTNQRVSAIVRGLLGVSIERIEDKRKAYFKYLGE
jgi:hypothetical protein